MKLFKLRYILLSLIALGLYSCSSTKYIPDGEYLLDKVKIESDIPGYKPIDLKPYLRQQPNYKMFGINKTMFQIYNLSGKDSSRWINRFLKRIGEEPVIFDSTLVYKTDSEFEKLFVNKGYINVDVNSEIIRRNKKANVIYQITGNTPYRIRNYTTHIEDSVIQKELYGGVNGSVLQPAGGESASSRISLIKKNMLFDRDVLDKERDRISSLLRNRGYYAFSKEHITYDADSALNSNAVDLRLNLHLQPEILPSGDYIEVLHKKYFFDKVYIYLDYDPLKYTNAGDYPIKDSVSVNNYTIYYQGEKPSIRPKTLINNCFITPGRAYSQLREEGTYSSLATLNALNNTSLSFEETMRNDTAMLNSYIFTMPAKRQAISFSVEGTNTAGDLGVASSVNYTHRNLFRNSETFNFKVRGAYEAVSHSNPYLELGGEASIHIPKIVFFPFLNNSFIRRMKTSTEFSLSYNYQTRREYDRTLLSGGLRYSWEERGKQSGRHQLDLIDIDYVYLPRTDSLFINGLPSSAKYFGYIDQFIVGTGYSYIKSTFDPTQKQRDAYSFRASIEFAGNTLYGISKLFDHKKNSQGAYRLFGTQFAQFVKTDIDYSKTIVFDSQNSLAWRIGGGIGIPYGNSEMLPFEKRYYSGGANSVRAWSVRQLGPGSYQTNDSTTFFNQSGDIKLDFNLEYRTKFFWKLEAAVFVDAGNIWTIKDYSGQEDGKFKFDTFYKEIALGYGLGLRFDFDFFLVRFDCGWKAYDPEKSGHDKWAILKPNFRNNWAWHIAVGYPF